MQTTKCINYCKRIHSRKFSIIKTIDIDILRKQIKEFIGDTDQTNPYIFANSDTINEMTGDRLTYTTASKCVSTFEGYKIFQDESLKFGEIEIR